MASKNWCDECGGAGRVWLFLCTSCGGRGVVATERVVRIQIPPQARPGSIIEMPLHGVGIHNLYLRLHVRIE
jgi:molecular chaperone DnaJ